MKTKKILALLLVAVMLLLTASCTTKVIVEVPDEYFGAFTDLIGGSVQSNGNNTQTTPENTTQAPAVENTTSAPVVENTTSAPVVENTTSAPVVENTTSAPVVENTTSAPAVENTTKAPEATTSAPAQNTGAPTSKEEIVAYYCTAYNKIGSDNAKITRTYDYTSNYNNICEVGDNAKIADLAKSAVCLVVSGTVGGGQIDLGKFVEFCGLVMVCIVS